MSNKLFQNIMAKSSGEKKSAPPPCVCEPGQCPVEERCQAQGVVYQATLTYQGNKVDKYVGLTARPFIVRNKENIRNFENR